MIDVLLFSIAIVAEKVGSAYDIDESLFYKQFECILELKTEYLVVIDEIEAGELIASEEEDLCLVEGVHGEYIFADGERHGFGLGVGYQLIGVGLVDDGGRGQLEDGAAFGFVVQFVRPAVFEHLDIN